MTWLYMTVLLAACVGESSFSVVDLRRQPWINDSGGNFNFTCDAAGQSVDAAMVSYNDAMKYFLFKFSCRPTAGLTADCQEGVRGARADWYDCPRPGVWAVSGLSSFTSTGNGRRVLRPRCCSFESDYVRSENCRYIYLDSNKTERQLGEEEVVDGVGSSMNADRHNFMVCTITKKERKTASTPTVPSAPTMTTITVTSLPASTTARRAPKRIHAARATASTSSVPPAPTMSTTTVTSLPASTTARRTPKRKNADKALVVSQELKRIEDTLNQHEIGTNQTVVRDVVQSLSQIMDNSVTVLKVNNTGGRILAAIQAIGHEVNLTEGHFLTVAPNLAVAASVNLFTLDALVITAHAGGDNRFQDGEIQIFNTAADALIEKDVSSLVLPASLLTSSNGSRVIRAVHVSGKAFEAMQQAERHTTTSETRSDGKITKINSYVMAASVEDSVIELKNLKDPVRIKLVHIDKQADNPVCVFWDMSLGEGRGAWSSAGCWRVKDSSSNTNAITSYSNSHSTLCECNHLTNFALLMDVYQTGDKINTLHRHVLSLISYTGCGVSVGALILTVLTYSIWKADQLSIPNKILLNLCTALGLSNILFVGGMQPFFTQEYWPCKVVAMLLHVFLLSSLCWMAVEAFYMYLSLVRVFRTRGTHVMLKCSSFAWGVPVVIVTVTAALDPDNYYLNRGVCWLSGTALYSAFVAPVGVIMAFNGVTFTLVLRRILTLSDNRTEKSRSTRTATQLRRAIGVLILLGLTWVFGFLAIDRASLVFQYLFAIFNSLHGTFIFTFYCVMNQEVRLAWRRSFCKCCTGRGESGQAAAELRSPAADDRKMRGATEPTMSRVRSTAMTLEQTLTSGAEESGNPLSTHFISATNRDGDE